MIPDEVKSQFQNAMAGMPNMVEEAVEEAVRAVTTSAQRGIRTVVDGTLEHVILDKIRMAVLNKTIEKYLEKYINARKPAEILGKRLLRNDRFLDPIASFVQKKSMDEIVDIQSVQVVRTSSMEARALIDAAMAAEASLVHLARACTSFERSSEEN